MRFAIISLFISGIIRIFISVGSFFTVLVGGIASIVILSLIFHLFIVLFGSRGYEKTLAAVAFGSAISPLFSFMILLREIPVLKLPAQIGVIIAILYQIYIYITGVKHLHNISTIKARASILIPATVITVFYAAYFILILMALGST